jgi:hypothetical protein
LSDAKVKETQNAVKTAKNMASPTS